MWHRIIIEIKAISESKNWISVTPFTAYVEGPKESAIKESNRLKNLLDPTLHKVTLEEIVEVSELEGVRRICFPPGCQVKTAHQYLKDSKATNIELLDVYFNAYRLHQ